jgi:hypothetical protein
MSRIGVLGCALAALFLAPASASADWFGSGPWFGPGPSAAANPALWRCVNAVALRNRLPPIAVSVRGVTQAGGNTAVTLYSQGSYGCTVTPDGSIVELIRLYASNFPPYGDASPYVIQCRFACPW